MKESGTAGGWRLAAGCRMCRGWGQQAGGPPVVPDTRTATGPQSKRQPLAAMHLPILLGSCSAVASSLAALLACSRKERCCSQVMRCRSTPLPSFGALGQTQPLQSGSMRGLAICSSPSVCCYWGQMPESQACVNCRLIVRQGVGRSGRLGGARGTFAAALTQGEEHASSTPVVQACDSVMNTKGQSHGGKPGL